VHEQEKAPYFKLGLRGVGIPKNGKPTLIDPFSFLTCMNEKFKGAKALKNRI